MKFIDGIKDLVNGLKNTRNPINNTTVTAQRIGDVEIRAIMRTGLGSKILRLKAGYALDDTIQFESESDDEMYQAKLAKRVKEAARLSVAFGRSIIVILEHNGDLSQPLTKAVDPDSTLLHVFGGDMVSITSVSVDLRDPRYQKPTIYHVRASAIHYSRVIDFKYIGVSELDAPQYKYGGVSEFELIRPQIIADEIVQRAVPTILEKASSFFYKITGFSDNMRNGNTKEMVEYFTQLEDLRGIYGAGVIDANDDVTVVAQSLTNLSDADSITLRRLAMVTGLSYMDLVGEGPGGLNANGEAESNVTQKMIETLQSEYLLDPINELMAKFGKAPIKFKENQGQTPAQRMNLETKAIDNAVKMLTLGEDYVAYLQGHGLVQDSESGGAFPNDDDDDDDDDKGAEDEA